MNNGNADNGNPDRHYSRPADTISATCFELLDEQDRVVAFVRSQDGVPHIGFIGRDGEVRGVVSFLGGQGKVHPAHLEVSTGDREMSEISMAITTPSIALRDKQGADRLVVMLDPDGHPRIACFDKDGSPAPPRFS